MPLEVIRTLHDDLGLSDGKSSEKEAIEQFYTHTGHPVFSQSDAEALGNSGDCQ